MKKHFLIIGILILVSFKSFSQSDYTFCYGSIAVTIFDGGDAEMIRYNSSGNAVSKVKGTLDLFGKGYSTEVLKILFQGTEYRYDLIRDGYGKPSKIFDNQMREYNLCKEKKVNSQDNTTLTGHNLSFFTGTYFIPKDKIKVIIKTVNGRLSASVYKNGQLYNFNTSCGKISNFVQEGEPEYRGDLTDIYLTPINCNEEADPSRWKPNYIQFNRNKVIPISGPQYYSLDIFIRSNGLKINGWGVKKVKI